MKLVYSILLSKEINKDEFVSFVKDTELLFVPRLSTRVSLIEYAEKMYQYATLFIVRDMDDDAATILMVDSNLQREHISPSERAFAYKMKLDALKNQGARSDLTSSQVGTKLNLT